MGTTNRRMWAALGTVWLGALLLLGGPATGLAAAGGDVALGESVYKEICFACHGINGDGKGPSWFNTRPSPQGFNNRNYMSRLTDAYMFNVVKYGKLAVLKRQIPDEDLKAVAMPSFEDVLDDQQIRDLIRFEQAYRNGGPQSQETREIFNDACAVCHGKGGKGNGPRAITAQPPPKEFVSELQPAPADFTDPLFMGRFQDDFLFSLIKKGRIGATEERAFNTMQPFGHVLSDEEIWGVVRYIRQTFIDKDP